MANQMIGGDTFEMHRDLIDVTSLHRVNPNWRHVDASGHEHRWHDAEGQPATRYSPEAQYTLPTLERVSDGMTWIGDEYDGEEIESWHYECRQCGAHVEPGFTADTTTQYIAGLRHYRINGEDVSEDEFKRLLEERQKR